MRDINYIDNFLFNVTSNKSDKNQVFHILALILSKLK